MVRRTSANCFHYIPLYQVEKNWYLSHWTLYCHDNLHKRLQAATTGGHHRRTIPGGQYHEGHHQEDTTRRTPPGGHHQEATWANNDLINNAINNNSTTFNIRSPTSTTSWHEQLNNKFCNIFATDQPENNLRTT